MTDSFTLVHYVRRLIVNEIIAGGRSGNTARSLRSLRDEGVAPPAREASALHYYLPPLSPSERSERDPRTPSQHGDYLVHCQKDDTVNAVERGVTA